MPYWAGALAFAAVLVLALVGLERWRPWRGELGRDPDGDLGEARPDLPAQTRIAPAE